MVFSRLLNLHHYQECLCFEMAKFQDNNLKDRVLQTSGIASSFEVNNITGKIFLHLKDLVPLIADRKEVQSLKDRYLAPVVVS